MKSEESAPASPCQRESRRFAAKRILSRVPRHPWAGFEICDWGSRSIHSAILFTVAASP